MKKPTRPSGRDDLDYEVLEGQTTYELFMPKSEGFIKRRYTLIRRTIDLLTRPHQEHRITEAIACSGIINDDSSTYTSPKKIS